MKVAGGLSALVLVTTLFANMVTIGILPTGSDTSPRKLADNRGAPSAIAESRCNEDLVRATWGPERKLFTLDEPAPFPTLNAISDNPNWRNEAIFLNAKTVGSDTPWCSHLAVKDGDTVWIRAFVENSAADNLVDEDGVGEGAALGTRFRLSTDAERSTLVQVRATLASMTTKPPAIWSMVELEADAPFRLDPVHAAGEIISNVHPRGIAIQEDPWSESGVLVGYDVQDGRIPPGYEYSILVLVKARVTYTGRSITSYSVGVTSARSANLVRERFVVRERVGVDGVVRLAVFDGAA